MVLQTAEQVAAFLAPTQEQLDAEEQERTLAELTQIDAASVRSLREFVLAKFAADPELPPYLADHDAAAQIKRGKLK